MIARRTLYNSIALFFQTFALVISSLVIPRLILVHYGSSYNGLIASITQFVGYAALLAAGVGGATRVSLYKPLAEKDINKVSSIIRATELHMRKVAIVFIICMLLFAGWYPVFLSKDFEWLLVFMLVLILGVSSFINYFFGFTYQLLLWANLQKYVLTFIQTGTTIINTVIAAILIILGHDIRVVFGVSAVVFAINPIFIHYYVKKRFMLIKDVKPDFSVLKQRWSVFVHEAAEFIVSNSSLIILAIFSNTLEMSVYIVYFTIIRSARQIIRCMKGAGVEAPFGTMIANNQYEKVSKSLKLFEFFHNSLSAIIVTSTALLILPFVTIYTTGVYDVNYLRPLFAIIICTGELLHNIRVPYKTLVQAAGHFAQTRKGAICEIVINVVISVILVQRFGIVGVAIGTTLALLIRTVLLAVHVSRHIVKRKLTLFFQKFALLILNIGLIVIIAGFIPKGELYLYIEWFIHALQVFLIATSVTGIIAVVFYTEELKLIKDIVHKSILKKRK